MDETLCEEVCFTEIEVANATPIQAVIDKVNELHKSNFIVIYTARRDFLLEETKRWLERYGVKYHAISNIKIPLDVYIDTGAINPLL